MQIPNLRKLRELHGLTQKELADVSGVSLRSVAGYEGGAHVRPNTARKLAQALNVEVADLVGVSAYPKPLTPQPSLEDAAQSEALQEALAVLFQGLTRRGRGIVEQSLREGPSEALSRELSEYYSEVAALHRLKGRRDIFGRDSDELAEAEEAYEEVEARIQAMLRQDIDGTEEERSSARRFKDRSAGYEIEEHEADAS